MQVAVLKGSGSAVVSYVRGTTGRFEDSTCNLPAQFANGKSVTTGAPSPGAAVIALSHNFALYVLTGDGMQILECKSSPRPNPFFRLVPTWLGSLGAASPGEQPLQPLVIGN